MKKVWIFKINGDIDEYPAMSDSGSLIYAWTKNKEYANTFKKTRNMDIFKEEVYLASDENFDNLVSKLQSELVESELGLFDLQTKTVEDGIITIMKIAILATVKEADIVRFSPHEYFEKFLEDLKNSVSLYKAITNRIFKDDILYSLNRNFYADIILGEFIHPLDDIDLESYDFDQVNLYIRLFKNTYKKE